MKKESNTELKIQLRKEIGFAKERFDFWFKEIDGPNPILARQRLGIWSHELNSLTSVLVGILIAEEKDYRL